MQDDRRCMGHLGGVSKDNVILMLGGGGGGGGGGRHVKFSNRSISTILFRKHQCVMGWGGGGGL